FDNAVPFAIESVGPGGVATVTTAGLSPGSHAITASYSGDSADIGSNSAAVHVFVRAEATRTSVKASINPVPPGGSVTLSATVIPVAPGTANPAGTVQFNVDGSPVGAPVPLVAGTAMSPAISGLPYGRHTLTAAFQPDASGEFLTSTGSSPTGVIFQSPT